MNLPFKLNLRKTVLGSVHKFKILRQLSTQSSSSSSKASDPLNVANKKPPHYNPNRILTQYEYEVPNFHDPKLMNDQKKAKELTAKYNELEMMDGKGKLKILYELLNPACRGRRISMDGPFRVFVGYNLTLGEECFSNIHCFFQDILPITIGRNSRVEPGVQIHTITHPLNPKSRREGILGFPVNIGNFVWICGKSIICPGVTIGDNVTVVAGSVVTKDVPPNVLVGGSPAKIIRHLDVT